MALMEAGFPAAGMSRSEFLSSMPADLAYDVAYVAMVRMFSTAERPYDKTRRELERLIIMSDRRPITDEVAVRRSIAAMAKYKKGSRT